MREVREAEGAGVEEFGEELGIEEEGGARAKED